MKKCILLFSLIFVFTLTGCRRDKAETGGSNKQGNAYYVNKCGVEFTEEQYNNLLLVYNEFSIENMESQIADDVKDDRTLTLQFDYRIDERLYRDVTKVLAEKPAGTGKTVTRDEAIEKAKSITDSEYDLIKIFTDKYREMWRVKFAVGEYADKYQYVYVSYDGTVLSKADVTSDMELSTYSKDTGKPYFTNVNGAEFTEEQYNNMSYAFTETEIVLMEKEEADKCKNNDNLYRAFEYQKDLDKYGNKIKQYNNTEFQEKLSRNKIVEKARDFLADMDGTIVTDCVMVYYDKNDAVWKIQCSSVSLAETYYLVYLDDCGNVTAYTETDWDDMEEFFQASYIGE